MNKVMTVGFAALMVAGIASAQDDMVMTGMPTANPAAEPEVSVETAVLSSYVWRGQVYNADAVVQPQITLSQYAVSFNIWGNYNVGGSDANGVKDDFSELDLSLAYDLPFNISDMAVSVGAIHYTFPNVPNARRGSPSTTELFAKGTITTWDDLVVPIIPSVTIFGDVDEAPGSYVLFDVSAPYSFGDYVKVTGGLSAGYGSNNYNDSYFGQGQGAGWTDYNIYGIADYEIVDNVTVSISATYTMLDGGVRDAAGRIYDDKQKFWGGFNVAYDF